MEMPDKGSRPCVSLVGILYSSLIILNRED